MRDLDLWCISQMNNESIRGVQVIEFFDVMGTTEKSGQDLMAYGRETHKAVRAAFDRYDRQARFLLKLIEEDDEAAAEAAQGAAHSTAVAAIGFSRPSSSTSVAVSAFRIATALATAASSTSEEASSASSSTVCADSDTLNAAAMRVQSSSRGGSGGDGLALIDPLEEDVWLQALRWRLAATWQKTLWHDSTRRYRQHYESLLGIEHNRRVVWASTLQAWKACIVKSFGASMPDVSYNFGGNFLRSSSCYLIFLFAATNVPLLITTRWNPFAHVHALL